MERFLFIKTLTKSVLQQMFIIPAAAVYYKTRVRKKGAYHLVVCGHIGDFLYTMGYARAFQKKHNIKKLRIVSVERFQELARLYPGVSCEYHTVSGIGMRLLCIANRYASGQQLFHTWKDCRIIEPANGFVMGFDFAKQFPQLNLKNCICQGALGLQPDSRFELPAGTRNNNSHKISFRKKVLLCPYAQAISYDQTKQLSELLARRLLAENYEVYVNAPQGRQLPAGTKAAYGSLKVWYENLGQYEAVIGIRSGLLDLAAFSGCRVAALYPPAYGLTAFYDLRQTGMPGSGIFQYELTGNMEDDIDAVAAVWRRSDRQPDSCGH